MIVSSPVSTKSIAYIEQAGIDIKALQSKGYVDLDLGSSHSWKNIWRAGHDVKGIHSALTIKELNAQLIKEYQQACKLAKFT